MMGLDVERGAHESGPRVEHAHADEAGEMFRRERVEKRGVDLRTVHRGSRYFESQMCSMSNSPSASVDTPRTAALIAYTDRYSTIGTTTDWLRMRSSSAMYALLCLSASAALRAAPMS